MTTDDTRLLVYRRDKSTLAYTRDEMARLIDGTTQAIIEAGGVVQ